MPIPIGVTTIKYTIPITMGEIIEPKKIPNLNHSLFNGVNNLELKIPKIKKIIDKTNDHNLNSSPDFKGHKAIIKNTTKNTSPKLRFDGIFILDLDVINYSMFIIKFCVYEINKITKLIKSIIKEFNNKNIF